MKLLENKKLLLTLIFIAALLVRLCTMVALQTYKIETEDEFGYRVRCNGSTCSSR